MSGVGGRCGGGGTKPMIRSDAATVATAWVICAVLRLALERRRVASIWNGSAAGRAADARAALMAAARGSGLGPMDPGGGGAGLASAAWSSWPMCLPTSARPTVTPWAVRLALAEMMAA